MPPKKKKGQQKAMQSSGKSAAGRGKKPKEVTGKGGQRLSTPVQRGTESVGTTPKKRRNITPPKETSDPKKKLARLGPRGGGKHGAQIYTKKAMQLLSSSSNKSPASSRSSSPAHSEASNDEDDDWTLPVKYDMNKPTDYSSSESSVPESIAATLKRLDKHTQHLKSVLEKKSPKTPKKSPPKTSSNKKWTDEKENLLATLWEEETHLYDAKDINYRNSILRRQTIERMAVHLDMTYDDVDTRMTSLRTVYRKAMLKPSGSGQERLTTKEKQIMTMLSFLHHHMKGRDTSSTLPNPQDNDEDVAGPPGYVPPKKAAVQQSPEKQDDGDEVIIENINESQPGPPKKVTKTQPEYEMVKDISSVVTSIKDFVCSNQKTKSDDDEYEMWGKIVAKKMRRMDEFDAAEFMVKVDSIALDFLKAKKN